MINWSEKFRTLEQSGYDVRGTWCPHGEHIVKVERVVDPWPCTQCTLADFERDEKAREEEYHVSLYDAMQVS